MLKDRLKTALRPLLDAVRYLPFALGRPPSPRSATIDPISRCNLRCPLCPTGRGHASSPGKGILSRDLYLRALDQLPKLECLRLFNWGESLQHPEIEPPRIFRRLVYVSPTPVAGASLRS